MAGSGTYSDCLGCKEDVCRMLQVQKAKGGKTGLIELGEDNFRRKVLVMGCKERNVKVNFYDLFL